MAQTAYQFAGNLRQEIMSPWRLAYDTGFGLLGTMEMDSTGFDGVIGNVAESVNLSPTRTAQLGAALTFTTLSALERATIHTLGKSY